MAETITEQSSGGILGAGTPSLFQGRSFWVSHNVPSRRRLIETIQQHGGLITPLEKNADIKLVDHVRKNLPANSYSYKLVEDSVASGKLENLADYQIGRRPQRPVGATWIAKKSYRNEFTLEEDQFLWDYMQAYEIQGGHRVHGIKVYQQIAEKHPRHSYQSWRDHYRKRLRGKPRPGGPVQDVTVHGRLSPSPSFHIDEPYMPPIQRTLEASPGPSADMARQGAEPAVTDKPESRKRKRDSHDGDPAELLTSQQIHPSPKRRVTRASSRRELLSSSSLQPRLESPETRRQVSETANQATELEDTQQEPQDTQKEKGKTSELDDTFNILTELPFFPLSPEPEDEDEGEEESESEKNIDAWVDKRLQTGKAKNVVQVIEALRCTSMDPHLADQVLEHLVAGKGIPQNTPGIWTPEDDKAMEGIEARSIERVLDKHGRDSFNARWEYLSLARAAGLETNTGD